MALPIRHLAQAVRRRVVPVPLRAASAVLAALACVASSSTAHAHGGVESLFDASPLYAGHWFVPVGLGGQTLYSRDGAFVDAGIEVSVHHFPRTGGGLDSLRGFGAFAQLQVGGAPLEESAPPSTHLRWALGAQTTWSVLGCELAVAHRAFVPGHADALDAAGAAFVTMGIMSVGVHVEAPLVHLGDGAHTAPAIGAMYTVKFPWDLGAPASAEEP